MAATRKKIAAAALFAVLAVSLVRAQDVSKGGLPADYVSDRCTMFFDCNYGDCCVEHDKAYFFGGTKKERRAADDELYRCVKGRGHGFIAKMMWVGVRIGGVAFLPTPFRWGFGKNWKSKKAGPADRNLDRKSLPLLKLPPVQKPAR
jgi:hypothetical protein